MENTAQTPASTCLAPIRPTCSHPLLPSPLGSHGPPGLMPPPAPLQPGQAGAHPTSRKRDVNIVLMDKFPSILSGSTRVVRAPVCFRERGWEFLGLGS